MESNRSYLIKSTMTYGAILGIIIVLYSLFLFVFNIMPVGFLIIGLLFIISLAIYFTGIYLFTKKIRNDVFSGNITYGQGLLIGTLVALFAAIITAFYTYLQNKIIDPDYVSRLINAQKDWMDKFMQGKVPQEQIDKAMNKIDENFKNYNALSASLQSIFWNTIFGFIISLITSAFLKKKTDLPETGQIA